MTRSWWVGLVLVLALLGVAPSAQGHALQPGYLELTAVNDNSFRVLWRVPDVRGAPMPIAVRLPESCEPFAAPSLRPSAGAWVATWIAACEGGLGGQSLTIEGLERTRTDVLVRYQLAPEREARTQRLTPTAVTFAIPEQPSPGQTFLAFLRLGYDHILEGLDHLLFVFALMLLVPELWRLAGAITSFTLAHSISLAAASLDWVRVPGPPVEAVIALSIMALAAESVRREGGQGSLTARRPWLICFPFGLLHGLGFAGALQEIGLPADETLLALVAFNLGVEAGQLVFVFAVAATGWLLRHLLRHQPGHPTRLGRPSNLLTAYAIGGVAGFWFVERVAAF